MPSPGWPTELVAGGVLLRPVRLRDAGRWRDLRSVNAEWLRQWEATPPEGTPRDGGVAVYTGHISDLRRMARVGLALPWVVCWKGQFVGQMIVSNIVRGSLNAGSAGYWISADHAGRGIIPVALAMAVDHSVKAVGLHRIEVNIRPENRQSRRVAEKLGLREEGVRRRYLHIAGGYRDHVAFAVDAEDLAGQGLLARYVSRGGLVPS